MADAQVTREVVRTLSEQASPAAVSRVVVRALSPYDSQPARVARAVVRTLSGLPEPARMTRVVVRTLSAYREATFVNAQLTIGLTWVELTRPSDLS